MRFFGKQKLLPYFETSLIQQVEFDKQREIKLQTAQDNPNVPKILQAFIEYFNNPSILETEGLFRTTGSLKSVRLLKEEIEKTGVIAFNAPEIEIITVASLTKLWLRELTDGVIPKELFDTFDAATGRRKDTAIALQRLGNISYETLKYIVKFLITLISYSEKNKMVIKNVCIVFGPTLFKCPSDCPDDGSPSPNYINESLKTSMMLKFIIENQEKLFINDEYRLVKEKEKVVDIDESNNIKKSNSVESLSSEAFERDVKFTQNQHQEINKLVKSTVASFINSKLHRSSSFTTKKEDSMKEEEPEKVTGEKEKITKKKSFSFSLKRSKSQIKDKETKDKEVKDKVELKDAPMLLSPLSNAVSAVLYDDTPPDVVQPKIKEKGSRDDLLKSTEILAQIKEKTSLENVRVQGEHSITAEPIIPIAATNNIIVLPSDVDNSAPPELPVSTPKFKRVGKSIPKLNTSGGTLLAPIDKKFDALTPISPANMLLSDSSTPTTSVVLNFNTELKPPKRPPPATPATAGQTSPKYLPGTGARSDSLTKTIQSMSDISTTSEAAPSPSKGINKLQYGRSTYGSAEQLTTPIKYSPATPGSAFITDFSTAITPTEHRNKLSSHLPEMPARPAPPPPMDQIQSPTVPASPKREQHLSFLPASPVTKKKSPLSPSVTNFSEPRVLSFLPNSNSSDNIEQKKHSSKTEEGSPPLIQTVVRNRSKKLKKVEIEKKENIEDAKSPKSLSPSKSLGTVSDPQANEANEQTDQFTPLQSKINSSTLILADKSPINLSQDLFKKSKSQLSRDDIKEVKETFKTLQNMVKESKCSESDLAQYKSLKKVIKTWQQSETKIPQLSPTLPPEQDELCKLKEEKNRVKRELAELKDTVAQKTKDGIMIPKEHKQLLKSLYERYCELKGQIEKLEPGDDRYNQLKQRKRELQEKIHQYQEEFQNINGHPIQTVQDIEPLKQEYSEYKVNDKKLKQGPQIDHMTFSPKKMDERISQVEQAEHVDYFHHDFNNFDLHETWKQATKVKDNIDNGRRFENACWRKFFQQKFNLKKINPSDLNWHKDADSCWLYGPYLPANKQEHGVEITRVVNNKRILKRKSDPAGLAAFMKNLPEQKDETKDQLLVTGGISF
ncbi:hypothetical protein HDV04_000964 [Boothiomyces sp. JEL0838]|nr:hypothetical protein HDV04_000964 [Boothiomyces sp. JEL0838]